jgi:hypothetical protein
MAEKRHGVMVVDDCLAAMRGMADRSVDLVMTSPPYEDARSYGMGFALKGDAWVQWCAERYVECSRVCKGLVCWIVEGRTRDFRWSATPALLMAELHRRGVKLRKPPAFMRVGIPGSGGPDWLRNDWEFCICSSHGKLPWSDNDAMGHEPKYPPGGAPSHRTTATRGNANGDARVQGAVYKPPKMANPGNVIQCVVGGGRMGSAIAHEHPAPFPEALAEFFIRSFCPPGGVVLDPFCGSGTTMAVAERLGRRSIGMETSAEYAEMSRRRIVEAEERGRIASGMKGKRH